MPTTIAAREAQDAAVGVLRHCGGLLWLDAPRFSPKWLVPYRPLWLLQPLGRRSGLARALEAVGLLPRRFRRVAHFDADGIVLTAYGHHELMRDAAREISRAMGAEIRVVPPQIARSAARAA